MDKVKVEFNIDKQLKASVVIQCPSCQKKHSKTMTTATNFAIACNCGQKITVAAGDLKELQKQLDSLKRMTNSFK